MSLQYCKILQIAFYNDNVIFQGFMSGQGMGGIFASMASIISLAVTQGEYLVYIVCYI